MFLKADLDAELEETHSLRDRYMKQAHRKELLVQELKDEIRFSQVMTRTFIAMTKTVCYGNNEAFFAMLGKLTCVLFNG